MFVTKTMYKGQLWTLTVSQYYLIKKNHLCVSLVGRLFPVRFFSDPGAISGAIFCGSVLNFWCDFLWVGFAFLVRFFVGRFCISGAFFVGRFCISGAIFRGSVLNFWCDFSWVGFEFLVRFFVGRFCISGAIFRGSV